MIAITKNKKKGWMIAANNFDYWDNVADKLARRSARNTNLAGKRKILLQIRKGI